LRANDGANAQPIPCAFGAAPGNYQSTPPNFPPRPQGFLPSGASAVLVHLRALLGVPVRNESGHWTVAVSRVLTRAALISSLRPDKPVVLEPAHHPGRDALARRMLGIHQGSELLGNND
jgi:hypothetical protein